MHKTGYVIIDNIPIICHEALFDSGAQSDNYISQCYVDSNSHYFTPFILEHNTSVRLGDSHTVVNITHIITLPISFLDNNTITHKATLNFSIMPMKHIQMIIGINSILFDFYDLFLDMLKTARNLLKHTSKYITSPNTPYVHTPPDLAYVHSMYLHITPLTTHDTLYNTIPDIPTSPDYEQCVHTWSVPLDEIAPEELDTPDTSTEVLTTYYNLLTTNVNPEFIRAKSEVLTFLRSNIALAVFCPEKWQGINGLEPLELEFLPNMPLRMRTPVRTIRPAILQTAKKEFDRLCKYMYVHDNSPITSPLVIAPKANGEVRFCGDYQGINKFIVFQQHYVPIVLHELQKARRANFFIDLDMKNAFHQITLALDTSRKLSILSEFGNVRPLYMPEGISPASGILNSVMSSVFHSRLDKAIVIHDNFLVLATDFDECYDELVAFITLCYERNVILGMKKSKIGYPEVVFFGYQVKDSTYQLTQERKLAVTGIVMPTNLKQIQSFLGATIFFKHNIPNYANIVAPLNDMSKKDFSFDQKTWTRPYEQVFTKAKEAILESIAITMVDLENTIILRTDASSEAWGGVLIQVTETGAYECIGLASGKWSNTAKKWDIGKQEAGAIYMSVRSFEWILRGKFFIIETDSKNILFLEQSLSPIICRWRIFLQGFHTCRRFILGKYNIIADWLSRQYCLYLIDHYVDHAVRTPLCTMYGVRTPVSTDDTIHTSICNASLDFLWFMF